jgi:hypothetical protein
MIQVFKNPFQYFEKGHHKHDKMLKIELSRTSFPHKIGILLSSKRVFARIVLQAFSIQNSRVVCGALGSLSN